MLDLAGKERIAKTGETGDILKEATRINGLIQPFAMLFLFWLIPKPPMFLTEIQNLLVFFSTQEVS